MKKPIEGAEASAYAEQVFGSADKARSWMHQYNLALGGTPVSKLGSKSGADEVMKILEAIARGGAV